MNVEEIRLQTFSNWPIDAPVEASRVAKSGFFATGNGLEVECHWCGSKISEWDYGDQVRKSKKCLQIFFKLKSNVLMMFILELR